VAAAKDAARVLQIGEHEVVVADPAMVRLFALVERAAASAMPVIIHGETGSGKEIIATALHAMSTRAKQPLVRLNCAAMPESLLESELFGHERGAFSGATNAKVGLIEQANGGTLFLDEIAELTLATQAKLLRVLEDFSIRRVGGLQERRVEVRIVAASHRSLATQVASGAFREDLYYRLHSLVLEVPALRQRPREIPLLAERFALEAAKDAGRNQLSLSADAVAALSRHTWPGNVRELRNAMRRAVVLAEGELVEVAHLPPEVLTPVAPTPAPVITTDEPIPSVGIREAVEQLERRMIDSALREHQGNQTRAAARLGITRQALAQKLAKYGMGESGRRG
jgi:DNA-binding NtrC family response regulator